MKDLTVRLYNKEDQSLWNNFINESKNGTFLFHRNFMEYHSDRFEDLSMLVFDREKLIAVFPSNIRNNNVYSHQGLTYGGLVFSNKLKFATILASFSAILKFCHAKQIQEVIVKSVPTVYHKLPSDEMKYILFLLKADLIESNLASSIEQSSRIKIQSNRIEGYKKAVKQNLTIKEESKFRDFWEQILIPNLRIKHKTNPVHTTEEIEKLAALFPKNIRQFNVYDGDKIVAGTTIFETKTTARVQYISGNADKQQLGSLDFLFKELIEKVFHDKKYFDFGISNENQGNLVNEGLLYWKECFGGRGIVYEVHKIKVSNYNLLDSRFV